MSLFFSLPIANVTTTITTTTTTTTASISLLILFLIIVGIAFRNGNILFWDQHGWSHRLFGAVLLIWLLLGCIQQVLLVLCWDMDGGIIKNEKTYKSNNNIITPLLYDIILGSLGIIVTATAARDFPHKYVSNAIGQSGTLSEKAMVTQNEMIEHTFYQWLNLWQSLYLHFMYTITIHNARQTTNTDVSNNLVSYDFLLQSGIALFLVSAPWLIRHRFPVHSFSHNWMKTPIKNRTQQETILYMIKKAQYVFYKHVILHGLNISVFVHSIIRPVNNHNSNHRLIQNLVVTKQWRIFWLCLNISYVMEFFLQSLVKRKVIYQSTMLTLNRSLMLISSITAIKAIVLIVRWDLCFFSLILNFYHKSKGDVFHTMLIASIAAILEIYRHNYR